MKRSAKLAGSIALFALCLAACDGEVSGSQAPLKAAAMPAAQVTALPSDGIERAAMCHGAFIAKAVPKVEGATIREADLLVAMHPGYIAASDGGEFDAGRLRAIGEKGPAYADRFRKDGGIDATLDKCREAFPAMARNGALPEHPGKSRRTCAALAAALLETYHLNDRVEVKNAEGYARMIANIEEDVIRDFWKEGFADDAAMQRAIRVALAEAVTSAAPAALLQRCMERYA